MTKEIQAIFLDVGNTLRIVVEDEAFQKEAEKRLMSLIGAKEEHDAFFEELERRYSVYRKRAKTSLIEDSEKVLWTKWLLPDYPAEKIEPLAGILTRCWRDRDGRRVPRADVKETVIELNRRGYIIGIIANTITETEIPDWIEEDGLTDYFKTVVLSSKVGIRKPMPEIYWEAAKRVNVAPENCAYVGDNPIRDVEGMRKANFQTMVLIWEPATIKKEPQNCEQKSDYIIHEIKELLDIFPPRTLA